MAAPAPHVAILGAGPTGFEAALAAADHGFSFTLYEAGPEIAENVRSWGHVRLFTPWPLNVSPRMRRHLERASGDVPEEAVCPTGAELVGRLLEPLADLPAIEPHLRLGCRVRAIGRDVLLKEEELGSPARAGHRFRFLVVHRDGRETIERAGVVLDCTGTWSHPNALGDGGIPAAGERLLARAIVRFIPDLVREGAAWAGLRILLAGAGPSAQTAARDLAALAKAHPGTQVLWVIRDPAPAFGAPAQDSLPERARLAGGSRALVAGASPAIAARPGWVVEALTPRGEQVAVSLRRTADGAGEELVVDRILSLTGSVGEHRLYRQLQVVEDAALGAPLALAARLRAAGADVGPGRPAFTADELASPEPGFYILGAKSFGRHPGYLMSHGWQQVAAVFDRFGGT